MKLWPGHCLAVGCNLSNARCDRRGSSVASEAPHGARLGEITGSEDIAAEGGLSLARISEMFDATLFKIQETEQTNCCLM